MESQPALHALQLDTCHSFTESQISNDRYESGSFHSKCQVGSVSCRVQLFFSRSCRGEWLPRKTCVFQVPLWRDALVLMSSMRSSLISPEVSFGRSKLQKFWCPNFVAFSGPKATNYNATRTNRSPFFLRQAVNSQFHMVLPTASLSRFDIFIHVFVGKIIDLEYSPHFSRRFQ